MLKDPTHIIHKLVVEVETSTTKRGFELRENAGKFVNEMIIPAIEDYIKRLEGHVVGEETIEIDKLVVDLQSDTTDLNDVSWNRNLSDSFEKSMHKLVEEIQMNRRASDPIPLVSMDEQTSPKGKREEDEWTDNQALDHGIRFKSKAERGLTAIIHFLTTGQRPWWIPSSEVMNQLLEIKQLNTLIEQQSNLVQQTVKEHVVSERVVERWIRQLSDEQLMIFVKQLVLDQDIKLQSIQKSFFYQSYPASIQRRTREVYWKTILPLLTIKGFTETRVFKWFIQQLGKTTILDIQGFTPSIKSDFAKMFLAITGIKGEVITLNEAENFVQEVLSEYGINLAEMRDGTLADNAVIDTEIPDVDSDNRSLVEPIAKIEKKDIDLRNAQETEHVEDETTPISKTEKMTDFKAEQNKSKVEEKEKENRIAQNPDKLSELELQESWVPFSKDELLSEELLPESGLILENAGLVLLHPFLKYFFHDLGLIDENDRITNPDLAVHVLHYVATGKKEDYEHSMVFEKYLVGIELEQPIERKIEISEEIQDKTKKLLHAVRTNWEPLSGTSDDGIRETFLVREGKLIVSDEFHRLIIEKQTVDILMDKLGWSLSMIHLPWKEGVLYVEWY